MAWVLGQSTLAYTTASGRAGLDETKVIGRGRGESHHGERRVGRGRVRRFEGPSGQEVSLEPGCNLPVEERGRGSVGHPGRAKSACWR
jgi:hypothetical protein